MLNLSEFQNPAATYGIHPFWFWNGEMDDIEIERQIGEMADKKVTGFFLCARQGMTIPYLSDKWFEKVEFAIDIAAKHGMDVWLYDEYPYPSGMAGGEVTLQHPDAKQYSLVHHKETIPAHSNKSIEMPWGRILFAKAVPVNASTNKLEWEHAVDVTDKIGSIQVEPVYQKTGLTAYNQKRFFTYQPKKILEWKASEEDWEIHCFLEEEIDDFKYYGTFVDPCHEEAMATFIQTTHEKYKEKIGHHFGKTVKGMFTDEIHLLGRFPWSPRMVSFIKENYGYDIRDYLHLIIHQDNNLSAKVRYHYYQAVHELTRDGYHKQVHDWCEENGLEYVAEVPAARMSAQIYSHVPGGDSAHEKLGRSLEWILDRYFYSFRANPKMISGLSYQLDRDRALIEAFHSVGWSMTLQDAKWMIDRLAAFGINFFNVHAYFYTLDAIVKHDAPPSQFVQNPYWKHYKKLGDYTARMSYIMSQGTPIRRMAVLDPTTSLWTHMGNPYTSFSYTGNDPEEEHELMILKTHWADLCKGLTLHRKDYDHLDPELLENAEIKDKKLLIGRMEYEVLILPPLSNLEEKAWKVIRQFMEEGGMVIANGLLPYEDINDNPAVLEEMSEAFNVKESENKFWEDTSEDNVTVLPSGKYENVYFISAGATDSQKTRTETLLRFLEEHVKEPLSVKVKGEERTLLTQHRKLEDHSELLFISNQEDQPQEISVHYEDKDKNISWKTLDLETGEQTILSSDRQNQLSMNLAAYASILIQLEKSSSANQISEEPITPLTMKKQTQWEMTPLQDNILRFHTFDLQLAEQGEKLEVETKTFIDQCEDLAKNQTLPVQFTQTFGTPMKSELAYPIEVSYQTEFYVENMPAACSLLMDRHAVSDDLDIFINDKKIEKEHFVSQFVYDHNNVTTGVLSVLQEGKNILQIKGKVHHDWEGVVDSLYFTGDFGVFFDHELKPILSEKELNSDTLKGPYATLPYYAGTIRFSTDLHLERLPDTEKFTLQLENLEDFEECAEVTINGMSLGVKAWSPYQWRGNTDILKENGNIIEVKVTNTLAGLMEGKYFERHSHSLKDVREVQGVREEV